MRRLCAVAAVLGLFVLLFTALVGVLALSRLSVNSQAGPPQASRNGDIDCDGQLTIGDPIRLLNYLFSGGPEPCAIAQDGGGDLSAVTAALERIADKLDGPCADHRKRLINHGDGTVTDACSGLMWQETTLAVDVDSDGSPDRLFNWQQAMLFGPKSRLAGYDDWRLPTAQETETLIRFVAERPFQFGRVAEFCGLLVHDQINYWTATEWHNPEATPGSSATEAFSAIIARPNSFLDPRSKHEKSHLLLVRNPVAAAQ